MKKIRIFAVLMSLICLSSCTAPNTDTVAVVNGEEIEKGEFMMIASEKKGEVFAYFADKYGAEYSDTLWTESFDGEKPSELISKLVTDELVPIKIQQKMAVEYGVLDSCKYSDFLKRFEKENQTRKKKKENNQIVYGVTEYSQEAYYKDEFAKTVISLKDEWKKEVNFGDSELKNYYEKNKDMYYRQSPSGEVMLYIFDYDKTEKVKSLLEKAKQGRNIDDEIKAIGGKSETLIIDPNLSDRYYDMEYPGLLQELNSGNEYTELLGFGDMIYFAKAKQISDGYKSYEEVKANVEKFYIDELYNDYINELVKEAEIKIMYENLDFSDI